MAPQLLDPHDKAHSPAAADVWAAGVMLCAMLLGRFPYDHAARRGPPDAQLDIYCQQHLRRWSDLPELQAPLNMVCFFKDIVHCSLTQSPCSYRPSAARCLTPC